MIGRYKMSYASISQIKEQHPEVETSDIQDFYLDMADDVLKGELNRDFDEHEDVVERQNIDVANTDWIQLDHYPVLSILYIKDNAKNADPTTIAAIDYDADLDAGIITLLSDSTTITNFTYGKRTVEVKYNYGYETVPADIVRYASALVARTIMVVAEQDIYGAKSSERMGDYQYKLDIMKNLDARFHYIKLMKVALIRKYCKAV